MQNDVDLLPLEVLAVQMHEFFTVLIERGFTEDQALKVLVMKLEQGNG
jgi:hypothetical protein